MARKELFCVRVEKKHGEKVRAILREHALLSTEARVVSEGDFLFFPLSGKPSDEIMRILDRAVFMRRMFEVSEEASVMRIPYEIIGDIAVLQLSDSYASDSISDDSEISDDSKISISEMAAEIMRRHKHVKVVAMKVSGVEGVFRRRNLRIIAGEQRTETVHRENGCRFKLDIEKVYFNPKLATERARIASAVASTAAAEGERIIDMFAGVGCFSIQIAKCSPKSIIIAIDINPDAIFYLRENMKLNKVSNIVAINENVSNIYNQFENFADRIIMNLPKESHTFLKEAVTMLKERGIIHYYTIESAYTEDRAMRGRKEVAIRRAEQKLMTHIEKAASSAGFDVSVDVIGARKVRPYSPYTFILGLDIAVRKSCV